MSKQLCGECGKKGDFFTHVCESCWHKRVGGKGMTKQKIDKELEKEVLDFLKPTISLLKTVFKMGGYPCTTSTCGLVHLEKNTMFWEFKLKKLDKEDEKASRQNAGVKA